MADKNIKIGSRKSKLALIQTQYVMKELEVLNADKKFEIVTMDTLGDIKLDQPLPKIGGKGLFTEELETALSNGTISFVVHSLKDLPTSLPKDMAIAAVCKREASGDVAIFHPKHKEIKCLADLPAKCVIGTSSLRRRAQLAHKYPHLIHEDVRGNLNTRLTKLDDGKYDGLLLAEAGVKRMSWEDRISQRLKKEDMLYCVGQGALAVECLLTDDDNEKLKIWELLKPLSDRDTTLCAIAERSFLQHLGGGCSAPVGVHCHILIKDGEEILSLTGGVFSLDGKEALREEKSCRLKTDDTADEPPRKVPHLSDKAKRLFCGILPASATLDECSTAQQLGVDVASSLMNNGASAIMELARQANEKKDAPKE